MGLIYKTLIRPLLFQFYPEDVHRYAKSLSAWISDHPELMERIRNFYSVGDERLESEIFGIKIRNPVGLAAGYDKNGEMVDFLPSLGFGFIVIGSVTAERNPGNDKPRVWRLPGYMAVLNTMGLDSDGADAVYSRLEGKTAGIPVGISIAKTNRKDLQGDEAVADYAYSFRKLYPLPISSFIEINPSCPNIGDMTFCEPENLDRLLHYLKGVEDEILRSSPRKPVAVKFSPDSDYGKLREDIAVCRQHGMNGYVIANASRKWKDLKISRKILREINNRPAALSGKPIRKRATEMTAYAYKEIGGKGGIAGCGGIFSAEDALEKIFYGASGVEILTGLFYEGWDLPKKMNEGTLEYMERNGFERISDMVGIKNEI